MLTLTNTVHKIQVAMNTLSRSMQGRWLISTSSVVLAATACSLAPSPSEISVIERMPDVYAAADGLPSEDDPHVTSAWWSAFEDQNLDVLVRAALESNFDIQEATARIEEVRAQYRIARSSMLPSLTAGTDASRFSQPANAGQFGAIFGGDDEENSNPSLPERPDRFTFSTFGVSLGTAYELDFWGRLNNGRRAAYADYLAVGADAQTVKITVAAETITGYFELRDLITRGDDSRRGRRHPLRASNTDRRPVSKRRHFVD